ncbi:MAG TPA: hypothetical protein VKC16_06080 [Xanthobacteraceae bacterium]|nr:hypothetical protein [Xanthobacteraceae bacterium]
MCLACQMEDELWFAYLDHVAEQKKAAAGTEPLAPAAKADPAPPFVCDEPE